MSTTPLAVKAGAGTTRAAAAGAFALVGSLVLASAGTLEDYLGLTAVAAAAAAALALGLPLIRVTARFVARWPEQTVLLAAAGLVVLAVVAFAVVFPHADVDTGMTGSDRDEDADIGARRLMNLEYPYYAQTYLGNSLTHMPGSLLLAAPFVLMGTSALQNLFWLPAFFIGVRIFFGDVRVALLALGVLLATPTVLRELLTGGDLIANNIYVLLLALLVLRAGRRGGWPLIIAAGFLGIALSSRANFLFVVPLLFSALVQSDGPRRALAAVAAAATAFLAVTLPFYLYDVDGFTPARTSDKLGQYSDVLPHAQYVIGALGVALVLGLALTRMERSGIALARNAALVQGLFVVAGVVLASAQVGRVDFFFLVSGYGLNVVFFAIVAALPLLGRAVRPAPAPHP